ncbi:MAG TPA: hypothetical protein VMV31_12495 [Terriglobales bacterium]|nr:hypothetical protein [Terriglobales bacterium]
MKVEDTILRAAWIAALAGAAGAWLGAGGAAGAGVGLGAGLALLNLHWLRAGAHGWVYHAVERSPEAAADPGLLVRLGPPPRLGRVRFAARLALLAVGLYAIFMSHLVPFPAVLAGLLAAPAGLIAGTVLEAGRGWRRSRQS